MKTIIIYATKYGFTKECVGELKSQLNGDVLAVDILKDSISSLDAFDQIIIGGSIYMGQINKKLRTFCESNMESIMAKPFGLFLCCGLAENFEQSMANAFQSKLIEKAASKECFGGQLRTEIMKGPDRLITNMMKKATANQGRPEATKLTENINRMAAGMNFR
jgi:menaquinone-dependent protoporphyrinogen oxidase